LRYEHTCRARRPRSYCQGRFWGHGQPANWIVADRSSHRDGSWPNIGTSSKRGSPNPISGGRTMFGDRLGGAHRRRRVATTAGVVGYLRGHCQRHRGHRASTTRRAGKESPAAQAVSVEFRGSPSKPMVGRPQRTVVYTTAEVQQRFGTDSPNRPMGRRRRARRKRHSARRRLRMLRAPIPNGL